MGRRNCVFTYVYLCKVVCGGEKEAGLDGGIGSNCMVVAAKKTTLYRMSGFLFHLPTSLHSTKAPQPIPSYRSCFPFLVHLSKLRN